MIDTALASHPGYQELVRRYREARKAYRSVERLATAVGLSERHYCDSYLNQFGPIIWSGSTTDETLTAAHFHLAFMEADED